MNHKPCPFCGGEPIGVSCYADIFDRASSFGVVCEECHMFLIHDENGFDSQEAAWAAWDRRSDD